MNPDKKLQGNLSAQVATDTFGPFPVNYYGYKHLQMFIHATPRKSWIYPMTKKSELKHILKGFLMEYKLLYPTKLLQKIHRPKLMSTFLGRANSTIRIIRSDNVPEFSEADTQRIMRNSAQAIWKQRHMITL
jgi:hypothetical protein